MWFFGVDVFKDWMLNDSLLWVHGKCTFLSYFAAQLLTRWPLFPHSGLGENHSVVRHFSIIDSGGNTHVEHKFRHYPTGYEIIRRQTGHVSVLLFRLSRQGQTKHPQLRYLYPSPAHGMLLHLYQHHVLSLLGTRERHATAQ